jgi:hypothetical protein
MSYPVCVILRVYSLVGMDVSGYLFLPSEHAELVRAVDKIRLRALSFTPSAWRGSVHLEICFQVTSDLLPGLKEALVRVLYFRSIEIQNL